jgi:hypothetical protein
VVDAERIPRENSSGCSAMHRIFGVRLESVTAAYLCCSSIGTLGEGTAKNVLSAVKRGEIVLEVH